MTSPPAPLRQCWIRVPVTWLTWSASICVAALLASCQAHLVQEPVDDDSDDDGGDDDGGDDDGGDDDSTDDADGDGYSTADGDCDDSDPGVYPGADEDCDSVDHDCDGEVTDGCSSCLEILDAGLSQGTGEYPIDPDGSGGEDAFVVECQMTVDGGGWTLIQRTTDDWGDSQLLWTDYSTFYSTVLGSPSGAFRVAGKHWEPILADGDLLFEGLPREESNGSPCDDSLYHVATSLSLTVPAGGSATATGYQQNAVIINSDDFSTTNDGPSTDCVNDMNIVPWFLGDCGTIFPTYYNPDWWDDTLPVAYFLDSKLDLFGNTADDVCSGPVDSAHNFESLSSMKFFLR